MNKVVEPVCWLKLLNVMNTTGDENYKGFYANFRLILVKSKDSIKDFDFQITGNSYENLATLDRIFKNEEKIDNIEDPILKSIYDEVQSIGYDKPIQILKDGDQYKWMLLGQFIRIFTEIVG